MYLEWHQSLIELVDIIQHRQETVDARVKECARPSEISANWMKYSAALVIGLGTFKKPVFATLYYQILLTQSYSRYQHTK